MELRVLLVEDCGDDAELVVRRLKGGGFEPVWRRVDTAEEMEQAMKTGAWDLIISDFNMPRFSGLEALELVKRLALDIPFILVSGTIGEETAVQAMKAGAADYLLKDNLGRLAPAVARELHEAEDRAARRRALHDLEESEASKAAIMETALDAIVTVDQENRVGEFNPAAEAMFGYGREQVVGKALSTRTIPPLKEAMQDLTGRRSEFMAMRADGTEFPAELAVTRIRGEGPASFTLFIRDITARKRAEAAAEGHRLEMESANKELEAKNEKLAELYGNAQRFVDNVSHEFRTPLTVIKGYAEAMAEGMAGPVSPEQGEFLGFIIDRTRDLAQMVDDLLDTSKLRAGTLRVDRRPGRVERIISQIRPMLTRAAASNKIKFVERMEANLPDIFADSEKIGRIIINLVVNAIKFSGEGTVVKLWAKRTLEGGAEVGVSDHGPGIAAEELNIIFERFKQVGDPQRSSTKGFGLGLNIAKEMVALNLGEMKVTSRVGRGSTFSFTLPPNDPAIVLRRHVQYMNKVAPGHTLTVVRVGFDPAQPISDEVRGFVASSVSPLDLILETPGAAALMVVSCSSDPGELIRRMKDAGNLLAKRFGSEKLASVRVEEEGSWRCPQSQEEAVHRILEELSTEVSHA